MIKLIEKFATEYASSDRIKQLIDHSQIFIMPSLNPDGFELGTRANANEIDLNRSFPDFTMQGIDSPEGRPAETQAIMRLHEEHHFLLALNFHGGALCVNIPWDSKPNVASDERFTDDPLMSNLARQYANLNPALTAERRFDHGVTYGYEWWHIPGGMQDWSSFYRESVHATIEITPLYWPRYETVEGFWHENIESLVTYLERGRYGVHIQLQNEDGQAIHEARVRLSSSPRRSVTYRTNLIHRPAMLADQTLSIEADGYERFEGNASSSVFDGRYQTITLKKLP
jgi:carboxypeptidase D